MGFEIAYDPAQNIQIVKAIEKHPVIYDVKKYPPVEYRLQADQAWAQIASELNVSETYLRSRWVNIRGCFKRYLKTKFQRATKDYYLARYLDFMVPFMNLPSCYTKNYKSPSFHNSTNTEDYDKNAEVDTTEELELKLVDSDGEEESFIISTGSNLSEEEIGNNEQTNADWNFFLSLLPDVQKMNVEQKSKFRNALFTAVDMVLYGENL